MKLNSLFQDGAVFQRQKNIPVWGKAIPSHLLKATFGGTESWTRSSSSGDFKIYLPALEAGGPYTLTVTDTESDESVTVNDILVGEVWLASGQSNMEYVLESDWATDQTVKREDRPSYKQLQEFLNTIKDSSKFRFFMVKMTATGARETEAIGKWEPMDRLNASRCAAVAAWFGKVIQEELDIPVGLICSSWGGTIAEAWTSEDSLMNNLDTAIYVQQLENRLGEQDAWKNNSKDAVAARLSKPDPGNEGFAKGWANPDFDDRKWRQMVIPGSWKQQEISGNGAVWFRRKVIIPQSWEGKEIHLHTGGIDKHDITYFNGVEIGRTGKDLEVEWYNYPRDYTIPAELVKAGENTIAIRAFSFLWEGAFWGVQDAYVLTLPGTKETVSIAGDWNAAPEFDWGDLTIGFLLKNGFGTGNPNTPAILFNGMINPLVPYAIRGAIWYQGESNATSLRASRQYLNILGNMIADWRFHFCQGDFPFIQVQLANFRAPADYDKFSIWALLRESQRVVCDRLPNVYMASAIDIGEADDIHPQDKKTVGLRMADIALANTYRKPGVVPCGPMYRSCSHEMNRIRLFFDNADGLKFVGDPKRSFYLFDTSGKSVPADSIVIEGTTVVVSTEQFDLPLGVKYAWSDNPVSTLYNAAGMPASSFSTTDELKG
ncbi:MAG: hypothetical protein J6X55_17495 [Victivallales bacterium]|nr:hypothetical protein [Victivallales bacterium]